MLRDSACPRRPPEAMLAFCFHRLPAATSTSTPTLHPGGWGSRGPGSSNVRCDIFFLAGWSHGWIDDAFEGEVDRIPARCCFCNFCRLLSRIAVSPCAEAHVDVSSAFSAHRYVELLFSFSLLVPTTWPVKCILSAVVAEPACPTEARVFLEVRACPCCLSNKE